MSSIPIFITQFLHLKNSSRLARLPKRNYQIQNSLVAPRVCFYLYLGRKTIIFDMDETLIHTNETPTQNFEIKVPFRSFQGRVGYGYVEIRPYAK